MKLSRKKLFFFFCLLTVFSSCTSEFIDIDRPGSKLSPEKLKRDNYAIGSFLVQMQGVAFPEQGNTYQTVIGFVSNYLGHYTTCTKELSKNHTPFNASNAWCAWPAPYVPPTVSAFDETAKLSGKRNISYAWALILCAQAFPRFTNVYGFFPLSMDADNTKIYTSQKNIYLRLIKGLNEATTYISSDTQPAEGVIVFAPYDLVYKSDFNKWREFTNSLKSRIAVHVSNVEPTLARSLTEQAVRGGVIEGNKNSCAIRYDKSGLWTTAISWGDSRICADTESYMTGYKDPRVSMYSLQPMTVGQRKYIGCRAGTAIGSNIVAKRLYPIVNVQETTPSLWLTVSEMAFCKVKGVLCGWNMGGGTAEEYYRRGVTLSLDQWGADGVVDYLLDDTSAETNHTDALSGFDGVAAKASTITIEWDGNAPMGEKMECLITQRWVALFPSGQEVWNEIRYTGYPRVFSIPQATNGYTLLMPSRIPFDKNQQIDNRSNYDKAVELLGGPDGYVTQMWWQK